MSEQIRKQLSEFVDDEMSVEECDFFVRRLQLDDEARARFVRYQMIGTVLRGEQPPATVARDASIHRTGAGGSSPALLRVGIAASIVLAAAVGLVAGDSVLPDSAVRDDAPLVSAQTGADTGLSYLIHHAGYSPSINRTLIPTNLFFDVDADDGGEAEPVD